MTIPSDTDCLLVSTNLLRKADSSRHAYANNELRKHDLQAAAAAGAGTALLPPESFVPLSPTAAGAATSVPLKGEPFLSPPPPPPSSSGTGVSGRPLIVGLCCLAGSVLIHAALRSTRLGTYAWCCVNTCSVLDA